MPGAEAEAILSAGLDLLLARDAKNKALVEKPRSTLADAEEAPDSDHVPAAVEREVRKRDGDCCQWKLDSGGICGSRLRVQIDHIIPKSRGGMPVIGNLRLLCEPHNKLAAWQKLGHGLMNRYCKDPRQPLPLAIPVTPVADEPAPAGDRRPPRQARRSWPAGRLLACSRPETAPPPFEV